MSIKRTLRMQRALRLVEALSAACLRCLNSREALSSRSDDPMCAVSMIV
ncbi:hypothetical protein KHF85_02725 [Xanthomonas translucens pv. graminis]|nr:hypothetical protein [Xanthomonas translucens]WIH05441.1 hypothetical protein KHF85_02725 [Xanthomonas translucens pv. graminis]